MSSPNTTIPADLIEQFEAWVISQGQGKHLRRVDLVGRSYLDDDMEFALRAWTAGASRPVEVTEEMVERAAVIIRNDVLTCGLSVGGKTVFCDDAGAPDEIRVTCDCHANARKVLTAALKGEA